MQVFNSLTVLLSLALASANASPIEKRQQSEIQCETTPYLTRNLQISEGDTTYTFSVNGTARYGPHLYPTNVVVSTDDARNEYTVNNATKFDFFRCRSSYMGDEYLFSSGLLKPAGDPSRCIQTSSGSVDTASQYLVADVCSLKEDSSQQQQTFYYDSDRLKFMSTRNGPNMHAHPTYFSRGDGTIDFPLNLNAGDGTEDSQFIAFV